MVPPEGMTDVGVKARVTGTEDLPTTRSEDATVKETDETEEKMAPDDTALDTEHALVRNLTPTEPFVGGPIVKPVMVRVTVENAFTVTPEVVITTAVAEVALHVAVKPATLLAPDATVGTREDTKKLDGYKSVKTLPE